jgi:putative transcriptional regulator
VEGLKGQLLVAGAGIGPGVFRQSVILIAEHDDNGALGYVLNRPSGALVPEIAPSLTLPLTDPKLYLGGPVQPEMVVVLAEFDSPPEAPDPIFGSVGFAPPEGSLPAATVRAKAFAGYAGWGPEQLEAEMETGSWIVEDPRAEDVFSSDPELLWRDVLRRKGGEFVLLSTMPYDPAMN